MMKKLSVILLALFIILCGIFYLAGEGIRDRLSTEVDVMLPAFYQFDDGTSTMMGIASCCFVEGEDPDKHYVYVAYPRDDTGEKAYTVELTEVRIGRSDGICTALKGSFPADYLFVTSSERPLHSGDRVIIAKIFNHPSELTE